MELFSVNRYTGDGDCDNTINHNNEEDILNALMVKVDQRRRLRLQNEEQFQKDVDQSDSNKKVELDVLSDVEEDKQLNKNEETHHRDFEILGDDKGVSTIESREVKIVLPGWLLHPTLISTEISQKNSNDDNNLSNISYLSPHTRTVLTKMGIERLFPVQEIVIPWILNMHTKPPPFRPRDICVSAPTGSGKTLAFAIPIVQLLSNSNTICTIRALIVLPVMELALQVYRVFKQLTENTVLSVALLSTQKLFHIEQECLVEYYKDRYYSKVDIVVTTPGRLVDHIHKTKGFSLKSLQFLVIDEADRIMDEISQNWLYHFHSHVRNTSDQLLLGRVPPLCYNELELTYGLQPHKLLFSATLSADPEKLQSVGLFQPKLFASTSANLEELHKKFIQSATQTAKHEIDDNIVGTYITPAELTEKYCLTESRLKPLTLYALIKDYQWSRFLCFTNSTESSARLSFVLKELVKNELNVAELSSKLSAKERSNILKLFSRGSINGVICSDALARGIDVPHIDIVISYDIPRHIKTYIHRIGRTARAGRPGTAITLLTPSEMTSFNELLASVGKAVTQEILPSQTIEELHANEYSIALKKLRDRIIQEKRYKVYLRENAKCSETISHDQSESHPLTLMEKLQKQADEKVREKTVQSKRYFLNGKKCLSKNFIKKMRRKDNAKLSNKSNDQ